MKTTKACDVCGAFEGVIACHLVSDTGVEVTKLLCEYCDHDVTFHSKGSPCTCARDLVVGPLLVARTKGLLDRPGEDALPL